MFQEGKVKNYQAERGFGFIQVDGESRDLFFHIKDMPNRNIQPQIGEKLKFRIVEEKGKFKADNIVRLDIKNQSETFTPSARAVINRGNQKKSGRQKQNNHGGGIITTIVGLILICLLAYFVYGKYQRYQLSQQSPADVQPVAQVPVNSNPNGYRCDGRIHCSQMNSREEARWFVRNCPGTKMDGNNDGEPCENDSRW
ncbi:cold shock domain-containing protein [Acinetobacter sp. ANC 4177]|uniref:cold shock domain-containing protein n=1 Tax=Acinetobacter sp. ANC 4177 TaxID=2529838 RepID=UPI00103DC2F3|nr:cold shock domain-containing protein [Acinetobacter sp. ANC 4177]TCB75920.1 cold-shock protein [Acinetobacter sp. ANC 4177]